MAFSDRERTILLAVRGVGPTVLDRLERIGIDSLESLADSDPRHIVTQVAAMLGTSCWKNSPQARAAIVGAVEAAKRATAK